MTVIQGSPEWFAQRVGKVTASRLADVMAKGKGNAEAATRATYRAELVAERLTGMVTHPRIPMSGASPDGLVLADGLLEIKCPETKAHIDAMLSGAAPSKYIPQMQWQMACTGRAWCDFVSFDPRMPDDMQMFVVRVLRDDALLKTYEAEVVAAPAEIYTTVTKLKALKRAA